MSMKNLRLMAVFVAALLVLGFGLLLPAAPTQAQELDTSARVSADLLNVRQAPGLNAPIVAELARNAEVTLLGRQDSVTSNWVYIRSGDITGWVDSRFLIVNVNIALLPIAGSDSVAVTTGAQTSAASPAVSGAPITATAGRAGTTRDFANFRTGPELTFEVIRQLPANTSLQVVGRNSSGAWLRVNVAGEDGWIFAPLVQTTGGIMTLPIVDGASPVTTSPSTTSTSNQAAAPAASSASREGGAYNINIGVRPGGNVERDGRLNPYSFLGPVFYCINELGYTDVGTYRGGGIIASNNARIVFFASEAEIEAAGRDAIIKSEGGYTLSRNAAGDFTFSGLNVHGEPFAFNWRGCSPGPILNNN